MKEIIITKNSGDTQSYNIGTIPFSNAELERLVVLYYGKLTCDRCRNAVFQSSFAKLMMEIDDNEISSETLEFFPILSDCKKISKS